ncbi:MAG: chemotaxis protein CheX [Pseudothermotoga sp.]|uniref:chemotaxis protein CheX n=1 Tax=Pseudothermotoga sp. TaxID=2033661 RepID=UPI000E903E6D|nr:chemotaxis protein CheX [Pseudothermotoga sp.]MDK2923404.1 chemotaxis protein CheX [Pseudothermotoga sp.]HBT38876.1 hypothetical protein [Pseudothermotoga sp.]HCO97875.1 hypothetical protein [Pseudothermotoga sp.]
MDKDIEKLILESFIRSMCKVYRNLTNKELSAKGVEKMSSAVFKYSGAVAIVGFSGLVSGRMIVAMPKELAVIVYEALGGEQPSDDDLLLGVGEFGNMVAGNAITQINNHLKDANVRLSPPSSFLGEDLTFFNFKMSAYNILFESENLISRLNIALREV